MLTFCKKFPIEWYVVVIPFFGLFLFFIVLEPTAFSRSASVIETFVSLAFSFLGFLTIVLLLYVLYKTIYMSCLLIKRSILDMFVSQSPPLAGWFDKGWVLSLVKVVLLFTAIFYFHGTLMRMLVFTHTAEEIALFSAFFTNLDVALFGADGIARLLIFSNGYPLLQALSVLVYDSLALVSGAVLLLVFLRSLYLFRTFIMGFFIIFYLSIPLWYIMPAISPSQFLLEGVAGEVVGSEYQALSGELATALDQTTPAYSSVYGQLLGIWQGKQLVLNTQNEFAITTNPSLHVALGMLCVYCAWRISLFFGIALAVYQSFNMLATVLLLQHYVIDVPFGLMVGVVGVLVARQALRYETEHMNVNAEVYFMVLETARRDIRKFCRLFVPSVWLKKNISAGDVIR